MTLVGRPVDRVDGPLKVHGAARYPADETWPDLAHAVLAGATVAAGRITAIDATAARAAPGVLAVITHENVLPLRPAPATALGPPPRFPLADDVIRHYGQYLAVVVARTRREAAAAARLLDVTYAAEPPVVRMDDPRAEVVENPFGLEVAIGDASGAEFGYDETFTIPAESNSPMGLFATVARWDGDRLTVHDSTQWPVSVRSVLAGVFGVPEPDVRVLCRFVGGGFGAGLKVWPHTVLAAVAARMTGRPVRLVLDRPQMFAGTGHRSRSVQRLRIAAGPDGRLTAIDHHATSTVGIDETLFSGIVTGTAEAYDCPNIATHDRQVRLHIPNPGFLRAPGHGEMNFAVESAMDELAHRLGIDPVELRLRNFRATHPHSGLPWSSNALRDCYRVGAARFGWSARDPRPRSTRDGDELIGYGMAGTSYSWYVGGCRARIDLGADGCAVVRTAATDIGTGTATIVTQVAADRLGLPLTRVRAEIGDTDLPPAPQSGGSGLATAVTGAVLAASGELLRAVAGLAGGALASRAADELAATDGRVHLRADPSTGVSFTEVLARHGLPELSADGQFDPADSDGLARSGAFAAHFVEVRVDEELGRLRVARLVTAVDAGRVLNEKTARSQILGGAVMGLGMALLEEIAWEDGTGRPPNATFGDYLIPVNADVPDHDITFVGEPDPLNPGGAKGIGEVGLTGVAAAVANAVFHATGRRVRTLPISVERLLSEEPAALVHG
ncbi:xanthine dehydrogenase family protein molybdopterin-binding subunit [Catenuloplanes atrovinosus]|uniref:Xanthine dehydrogenase YagR molybdenum-binding subunit n=1 Tax=Catenuloplanes atrovinosus TaxID=137266 RepID=A0AAE3YPZ0_9ACTN|nr:xanthine dehydrogenase family protein molybdopterin-binding subunit [Catenuloplanes atrovinosus]MDR7277535.1 xanthine dehydrogenase YagR molybdenum-binding subunit [Catenuloplanes atrovinosus]